MKNPAKQEDYIEDKQVIIPPEIIENLISQDEVSNNLYITRIGFFPKITFHYRERKQGCPDNILFYCLGGKGYYHTQLGSFTLTPNHFVILPANQYHKYYADIEDPWTIYWVHYRGNKLLQFDNFFETGKYIAPTQIQFEERIVQAWEEMYYAVKSGFFIQNIARANLFLPRFISLFVHPNIPAAAVTNESIIPEVKKFLRKNISSILTVGDIAEEFNYSVSHFSKLFRRETGRSPLEYFNELKIHHSCQLLDQSNLLIKQIASKVGYDDPYYFSRIFTKIMGRSPRVYRAENNLQYRQITSPGDAGDT